MKFEYRVAIVAGPQGNGDGLVTRLNVIGGEGWQLVAVVGAVFIFIREVVPLLTDEVSPT